MLSFLHEQGLDDLPASKSASSSSEGKKPQEQEYLTVATKGKQVRKTTMMLGIVFVLGMLCLLFMIKKTTPQTASAADINEESKIQEAIVRLTGARTEIFGGMDKIVNKFYEFSDVAQVEVDKLVKNPFELEMFLKNLKAKSGTANLGFDAAAIIREQMKKQADDLQLFSIMQSEQGNCCMIDNKILYEGDSVGDFKVSQISNNFVKLEWLPEAGGGAGNKVEGVEIVLKLSE